MGPGMGLPGNMDRQAPAEPEEPGSSASPIAWTLGQARAVLKDWVCLAKDAVYDRNIDLAQAARIDPNRFRAFAHSRRIDVPTADEIIAISEAAGHEIPAVILDARQFLDANGESVVPPARIGQPPGECTLASPGELKAWLRAARMFRRAGRLSQVQLSARLGISKLTLCHWENPSRSQIPSEDHVRKIASICGVPAPEVAFERMRKSPYASRRRISAVKAETLAEEILWTGRVLSSHAHDPQLVERNATIFQARFSGEGESSNTLQLIGDIHGMTRERVRQIVDKQMLHLESVEPRRECFDALHEACRTLTPMPMSEAEATLRPLLGPGLSLQGAIDYGIQILGSRLPLHKVKRKLAEPIVVAGDFPDWFDTAISASKTLIRHSGAAQFTLAWAMTLREYKSWISPEEFRKVIEHAPGFEWVDEGQSWFWFGPEGSANRVIKRAIEILAAAKGALDIEVIYGGLARYSRGRMSEVAEHAGVWPPIDVLRQLLARSPAFHCQQGDDFKLLVPDDDIQSKAGSAQLILKALEERGGVASRSELRKAVVDDQGVNAITFAVTLSISPLIRQVDRGVFAIRGWPIEGTRLIDAQRTVGGMPGGVSQPKDVQIDDDGEVSWLGFLTEGAIRNRAATLPVKAGRLLPPGEYKAGARTVTIVDDRINGLVALVLDSGGQSGCTYRVSVQPATRSAQIEILDPGESDEGDDE